LIYLHHHPKHQYKVFEASMCWKVIFWSYGFKHKISVSRQYLQWFADSGGREV